MNHQPLRLARLARLWLATRMTTCMAIVAMTAVPAAGAPKAAAASDRTPVMELEPGLDARCVARVSVDSAWLVRAVPQWWSRQFKWEGVRFTCDQRAPDGSIPFTWNVPGLSIAGRGEIVSAGTDALRWKWRLAAEKQWPVEGEPGARQPHGGLTFFLDLKSPARRGCTADPVLKADRTGFAWEVTPGKTIVVRFSTPLAALYFERGNKSEIRCMFYDAPIAVGRLEQSMSRPTPCSFTPRTASPIGSSSTATLGVWRNWASTSCG